MIILVFIILWSISLITISWQINELEKILTGPGKLSGVSRKPRKDIRKNLIHSFHSKTWNWTDKFVLIGLSLLLFFIKVLLYLLLIPRKDIRKNLIHSLHKAVNLTCLKYKKCLTTTKVSSLETALFTWYSVKYCAWNRPEKFQGFWEMHARPRCAERMRSNKGGTVLKEEIFNL